MMLKMKCFGALAGCAFATGALYATAPTYSENFEGASSWTGGTVTVSNYTYSVTGSALPLPSDAHTKVLVVEGSASYTNTGTALSGAPVVDMMVQTARPDDDLEFPSSETMDDIQIAVAVDSNGCFNAYC